LTCSALGARLRATSKPSVGNTPAFAAKGKLALPVLAIGGERSFGTLMVS